MTLPFEILQAAQLQAGAEQSLRTLSGLGRGSVWLYEGASGTLIIKASPLRNERDFYAEIAAQIRPRIYIPQAYFNCEIDNMSWIGLEYVPRPLPRARWQFDEEVIGTIARLHELGLEFKQFSGFKYEWPASQIRDAVSAFPVSRERERLEALWLKVLSEFGSIIEPSCFVAGDPNGTNWGLSNSGQLVLYDWERAGFASPAIDLMAIAFDQLSHEQFLRIAEYYLSARGLRSSANELAMQIKAGRTYIVSEILARAAAGDRAIPSDVVAHLVRTFPGWLEREFR